MRGTIRRRLLVNAAGGPRRGSPPRLPGAVVPTWSRRYRRSWCCLLLDIESIRLGIAPLESGSPSAAAHRVSAEWEDEAGATTVGVYVPVRHSDSQPARIVGGQWFRVHRRARVDVSFFRLRDVDPSSPRAIRRPRHQGGGDDVEAVVGGAVGQTCPRRRHQGLARPPRWARGGSVDTDHRTAREVVVDHLDSAFLAGFSTARPATSYLMAGVGVT